MLEQVGLLGQGNEMPKATRVREEFLNVWHSTAVRFSCGFTSLGMTLSHLARDGRCQPVPLSICALWLDEPWTGGTNWWGIGYNRCCISWTALSLLLFLFLSFDWCYLSKAITLTSQQDLCPGQRLQHFPSQKAMWWQWQWQPQAQSHDNWSIAAGFWVSKPQSILYHYIHMDSACLLQKYILGGQEQTFTMDNSSWRSRALAYPSQQELSIKLLLDPLPCFSLWGRFRT